MAKVLIIGSGGREHAFAQTLLDSPAVERVFCAPGNAGTAGLEHAANVPLENKDIPDFVNKKDISLVIIGPEAPLAAGLADELRAHDIPVLGPSATAAHLEASKAFATEFMQAQNIPLPPSTIANDASTALRAVVELGPDNSVIKADGLAGGKGVVLPTTLEEAEATLQRMFDGDYDGQGNTVVVQQRYHGPEVSAFVFSDGHDYVFIPLLAQDHKRLLTNDKGPNTGGMGAYAPLPEHIINQTQIAALKNIASTTITAMAQRGTPYQGILYIGAMLAEELDHQPVMIEYNVRFGDPEAQVILPLLSRAGVDLYKLCLAAATGKMSSISLPATYNESALTICLAAKGYPDKPHQGDIIEGIEKRYPHTIIFHGSTAVADDQEVTNGGRVLYVTGFGPTLGDAQTAALSAIGEEAIHFEGMQYRTDIGYRAISKRRES